MASGCILQHPRPCWNQCPHPLQGVHQQQNCPEEVPAATGRGAESGVHGGKKDSIAVDTRSQPKKSTPATDTKTETVPGAENLQTK